MVARRVCEGPRQGRRHAQHVVALSKLPTRDLLTKRTKAKTCYQKLKICAHDLCSFEFFIVIIVIIVTMLNRNVINHIVISIVSINIDVISIVVILIFTVIRRIVNNADRCTS